MVQQSFVKKAQKPDNKIFNFEFAQRLTREIAVRMALLKIKPVVNDLISEIESRFSTGEIKKLEQSSPSEYTNLIQNKIRELSKNNAIKQTRRAETFAILSDMNSKYPKIAEKLFDSPFYEINKSIMQIARTGSYEQYKPNINNIEELYGTYKKQLTKYETNTVFDTVLKYIHIDDSHKEKLMQTISNQRNYMLQISDKNSSRSLKTILLKTLMTDFDSVNGTNYLLSAGDAVEKFEEMQKLNEKIKILDDISWDELSDSVW